MPAIPYDPTRIALYTPQDRPTVFVAGRDYAIAGLSVEAARLAYVHGEDRGLELERLGMALSIVGFQMPEPIDNPQTGTQAYGAFRPADRLAVLAFRGTDPEALSDLATDLDASLTPWSESAGNVHEGFARAARSVFPDIMRWLNTNAAARSSLVLTGHSLGAAIATLVASVCRPDHLITIGCPRVGDATFATTLDGINAVRFVGCCDAVTELPPAMGHYVHAGPMTYITAQGVLTNRVDDAFVQADRAAARAAYLRDYAWRRGNVIVRDLADHAPINYVRAIVP